MYLSSLAITIQIADLQPEYVEQLSGLDSLSSQDQVMKTGKEEEPSQTLQTTQKVEEEQTRMSTETKTGDGSLTVVLGAK